ncbi:MAG: 2-C-methyl-D-erythritol 4-phosphate cytidylyltransferase [Selenomonas sp.]|nr:2-C-methyl-D-erythritol 4-phosphate cytidylyltransferase [Selenomonas sp.]
MIELDEYTLFVDVDGTLCPAKKQDEDYSALIPYQNMVERLKELHSAGVNIVLFTSRNMRTYHNDLSKINKYTAKVLADWLIKWDIPYDGILYGKPWPGKHGFYVDDRSIRPDEFLQHSLPELEQICKRSQENITRQSRRMTVVITMAGIGSRFRQVGYNVPKYQIEVKGKTLFAWSMESLQAYASFIDKYIFVVRHEDHATSFIKTACAQLQIDNFQIVNLEAKTDGQATTCRLAIPYCDASLPIMIYNIDTYVEAGTMQFDSIHGDGFIPCFTAKGDHWSFVKIDKDGRAIEVREKTRISDNCSIGSYYFSSAQLYASIYDEYYANVDNMEKNEKYIAPMYNYLIAKGRPVYIEKLPADKVHVLGTPEEVNIFAQEG